MPKKTKNRSSKQAKQQRQAKARDYRRTELPAGSKALRHIDGPSDHQAQLAAFDTAWATGTLRTSGPAGQVRDVTVDQLSEHVNADLAGEEGEPPADMDEVKSLVAEDILNGEMRQRADGVWETPHDYGSPEPA